MCGRYTLSASPEDIVGEFSSELALNGLEELEATYDWQPRFNIAPSQYSLVAAHINESPQLMPMRWGLVPSWAKDEKIAYKMINARAETVAEKPAFRSAFRQRRCLVFANGYYEWTKHKETKQPVYIKPKNGKVIAFAGLWEQWQKDNAPALFSYTIITTKANSQLQSVHHRMPVCLSSAEGRDWMIQNASVDEISTLLRPAPSDTFTTVSVSNYVNSPRNEGRQCIEAIAN